MNGTGRMIPIVVNGERVGVAPFGFASHYKSIWQEPAEPEVLRDLLELVGWTADLATIAAWPLSRRVEAEAYVVRVHLRASDNIVRVPQRPRWMGEPWKGPQPPEAHANPFWESPNPPTVLT